MHLQPKDSDEGSSSESDSDDESDSSSGSDDEDGEGSEGSADTGLGSRDGDMKSNRSNGGAATAAGGGGGGGGRMKVTVAPVAQSDAAIIAKTAGTCCICMGKQDEEGEVQQCDGCGLEVHGKCYGEDELDDDDEEEAGAEVLWFCEGCKAGVPKPVCAMCPNEGGAFKQLDETGQWIHVVCALYIEKCEFGDADMRAPVLIGQVSSGLWGAKPCSLCKSEDDANSGVCIKCDAGMCRTFFHPMCGQRHGLLRVTEDEDCEIPYFAHCSKHSEKGAVTAQRREWNVGIQRWAALDRQARAVESKELVVGLKRAAESYTQGREEWVAEWPTTETREVLADVQSAHQERLEAAATAIPIAPELTMQFFERFNSHTERLNQLLVTCTVLVFGPAFFSTREEC
jgi:hypothetical protein